MGLELQCCSGGVVVEEKRSDAVVEETTATTDVVNRRKKASIVAGIGLLVLSATGGTVLVWWLLQFRPSNGRQWMVPVGLILFCTPIVVWFSVFASEFRRKFESMALPVVATAAAIPGTDK